MKKIHTGRGLLTLLLVSICFLGFVSSTPRKADTAKSASAKSQFIDPEDMVQGGYYLFWDHGSGVMVVQYDRVDNGTMNNGIIYNTFTMIPSQSLFSINTSCTVYDAGNIQSAGLTDIVHLLRCILAGRYVP